MKEIKFTTNYEQTLSFSDKDFKKKYEEKVGENDKYLVFINGEQRHMAVCPRCNNPVVILGVYKKIDTAPHARHAKGIDLPGVAIYNEYKYINCPYHKKRANYIKEYVPKTEEPEREELYRIAKENFDKAIYLLQDTIGLYITLQMAEELAANYAGFRVYNYIDATIYNIPWYLIYSFNGFNLYHMVVKKNTTLYRHLKECGIHMLESRIKGHVFVEDKRGYVLTATDYRYVVDKDENLNEWLDFSILKPDDNIDDVLLFQAIDRFSVRVDSYHFGNLVNYKGWTSREKLLEVAEKHMSI